MTPLYQRVLGAAWAELPPQVRALHTIDREKIVHGLCRVRRGKNWAARILATLLSLPKEGDNIPLTIRFIPTPNGGERWERQFGAHRFVSVLQERNGLLEEQLRFIKLRFKLSLTHGTLAMQLQEVLCCGIPCARWLLPQVLAEECERDGCFQLMIVTSIPFCGDLVHYAGTLEKLAVAE